MLMVNKQIKKLTTQYLGSIKSAYTKCHTLYK